MRFPAHVRSDSLSFAGAAYVARHKQIDALVYELHALTPEEIAVVEGIGSP